MNTNIELEIAPIEEVVDAILEKVNKFFLSGDNVESITLEIESDIAELVDELREGLYCVIEYPYVDKVYRDSYYHYYSSKHFSYKRDCIRVSLFSSEVTQLDFLDPEKHNKLKALFLGFFVLRPTINSLLGRSMIDPSAFFENGFKSLKSKANVLVYGVKLEVEGFPHCSQDGETIKCAETTIWMLMEYFGTKYPEYKPTLPGKIHEALKRFSYQRQLPSNGLTMDQISFALKEFGFGTRVYSQYAYENAFFDIIDSYVESGIPVIIGLESGSVGHVIIAIGKQHEENIDWCRVKGLNKKKNDTHKGRIETSSIPSKYVVQDDNLIPYRLVSLEKPGEHYHDDDCSKFKIDSIVVPLYPKIYLESYVAKELATQILIDNNIGYEFESDYVFRFFLTSSRSFKNHVAKIRDMSYDLKNYILVTKMPKFIWCGEVYSQKNYSEEDKIADSIVLLDATEANQKSIDALIFAGYPDRCISLNENNFITLKLQFHNYRYFSNLK